MRKFFAFYRCISVLLSCRDEICQPSADRFSVEFNCTAEGITKTSINGTALSWNGTDAIGVFVLDAEYAVFQKNEKFVNDGGTSFKGMLNKYSQVEDNASFITYYPYTKDCIVSGSNLTLNLPQIQTVPFDGSADYMVSNVVLTTYDESQMPTIQFTFNNHLFSLLKITVKNSDQAYESEKLLGIDLHSSKMLCGQFSFDITDGASATATVNGPCSISLRYDDESAPDLGLNTDHVFYAVIPADSYNYFSVRIVTENYKSSYSTTTSVTTQRGVVTNLPEIDFKGHAATKLKKVVLWGDSITDPGFLESVQKELGSEITVIRAGVSGDTAPQVAGRQGGLKVYTQNSDFVLYADSEQKTPIDDLYFKDDYDSSNPVYGSISHTASFMSGYCPQFNPVVINGIECELTYDADSGQRYLNRIADAGDGEDVTISARREATTYGSRSLNDADLIVVYIGTNARPTDDHLIWYHNQMKAHLSKSTAEMIVLGFHQSTTDFPEYWSNEYVTAFTNAFGDYYIDMRTLGGGQNAVPLMKEIGQITDQSQISSSDWVYINRGDWPISWFGGAHDVHPNTQYGDKVMAILLRNRMIELGML